MERYLRSLRDVFGREPNSRVLVSRLKRDLILWEPEDRIVEFEAHLGVALEMILSIPSPFSGFRTV